MIYLVIRRLLMGLLTLFLVASLTFFLLRLMPGGPFDEERALPPAIEANLKAKYHLDKPLHQQYVIYLGNIARGDLGPSYKFKARTVNDIVAEATGTSFRLGLMALFTGTLFGTLIGTLAGITRSRRLDGALSLLGVSSMSMPSFIFGGMLVLVFALKLNWLPAATLESPAHYILPVLALSLLPFSYAFLLVRSTVKDVKNHPFVLIKRSAGLDELRITFRHVLRNSLIPLASIMGPIAAAVITGSFAIEFIFAVPGLGKHFVTAVSNRDYTLVMGITLVYSSALILFNLITDILYGFLDPRIRDRGKGENP